MTNDSSLLFRRYRHRPRVGRVTTLTVRREGDWLRVGVASNLGAAGRYVWFLDAHFARMATAGEQSFRLPPGRLLEISVWATVWRAFPGAALRPPAWPATRLLQWVRSVGDDVVHYLAQYKPDGGSWSTCQRVRYQAGTWQYEARTPALPEGDYELQALPVDQQGNEGSPLVLDVGTIVRRPEQVAFTATWDQGTGKVTFDEE